MEIDWQGCEALVERACEGDDAAWSSLVAALWPWWLARVRRSRELGSMALDEDHVHDVVARLVDKLAPRGGAALGLLGAWRARHPDKGLRDWLSIVTAYTVRDHVRHALGQQRARDPDLPSVKRLLNEFSSSPCIDEVGGWRPSVTVAQSARQLAEFAATRLSADQTAALALWLQGADHEEIAADLGLDGPDPARRTVRSAIAVLRRHFASG